jgi:predicted RNase H-like HicB family nuclease
MRITAVAQRSGPWWAVEVQEIPGLFTQTKRLDQIAEMVRDAAATLTGEPEENFEVVVAVHFGGEVDSVVDAAREAARLLAEYQAKAAATSTKAAASLADEGLTVREVGEVLGVSHQRAHQLISKAAGGKIGTIRSKSGKRSTGGTQLIEH